MPADIGTDIADMTDITVIDVCFSILAILMLKSKNHGTNTYANTNILNRDKKFDTWYFYLTKKKV